MNNTIAKEGNDFVVLPSLAEFKNQLKVFDWNYRMTDNREIYARGYAEEYRLKQLAKHSIEFQLAFVAEENKHFK